MPVNKNNKHEVTKTDLAGLRRPNSKAPGTRAGTLEDWRGGSAKSGRAGRCGNTIRDGR